MNVQIDDMRRGVHEHLEFGAGEIDFPPVLRGTGATSATAGWWRSSCRGTRHAAPAVAADSLAFLRHAALEVQVA